MNLDQHPVADSTEFSSAVPVIDLSGSTVVEEIAAAAREWGFFQVVNHGISSELIDEVANQATQFFALPADQKRMVRRNRDNPWGYFDKELTKNQLDKKEIFDFTVEGVDPVYGAVNQWPDFDPLFAKSMTQYFKACLQVALQLMEAFANGLGCESAYLRSFFESTHTSFMRLNHYPKDHVAEAEQNLGVHHHTDAGALTLLRQHEVSGLQVHKDEQWHNIAPLEGALVINTGDMMQVWSNDAYRAPVHRVLGMKSEDRLSFPFFLNPAPKAVVAPLPTVVTDEQPARYLPIDWSEFRRKRSDGDYADYGSEVQISDYRQ